MKKTCIVILAIIALMGILAAGCAVESAMPSPSSPVIPSTPSPVSELLNSNTEDTASEILQSGVPLKVTEPADAAEINTTTIAVKGQTVPGAAVSVNDTTGIADSEGNFTITIGVVPGPNAVDVIATDDRGKQGEVLILVNVIP